MKIAYIILAHKNPEQLKRLVQRLIEPWTNFIIHIDKNTDIEPFKRILPVDNKIIFLEAEREAGIWGDYGIIKATLKALEVSKKIVNADMAVLLSGQDYPLHNNQEIRIFFEQNPSTNFISLHPIPHDGWLNKGLPRINKYKFNKSGKRGHFFQISSVYEKDFYSLRSLGQLNFLRKNRRFGEIFKIFKKRKFPNYLQPYGGSVYWALPMDTIDKIFNFLEKNPSYLRYHKYTLCVDEIFFHSIIMHLQSQWNLKISPSLTYVNWERKNVPLPVTMSSSDWPELDRASKTHLFARKFDADEDEEILNTIDKRIF